MSGCLGKDCAPVSDPPSHFARGSGRVCVSRYFLETCSACRQNMPILAEERQHGGRSHITVQERASRVQNSRRCPDPGRLRIISVFRFGFVPVKTGGDHDAQSFQTSSKESSPFRSDSVKLRRREDAQDPDDAIRSIVTGDVPSFPELIIPTLTADNSRVQDPPIPAEFKSE